MRSVWKGVIAFGTISVPARLYAATDQRHPALRHVHRADGGRIRMRRVCEIDGQEVPFDDVAHGYETAGGEMVVLDDDDLAALPAGGGRRIEVLRFTPEEQLDPVLAAKSYYLVPETEGLRAYVLLREALARSGAVALVRVTLRRRESLAAVRVRDDVFVLQTLVWPDEVRPADFDVLRAEVAISARELKLAGRLIAAMTSDFADLDLEDDYAAALWDVIADRTAAAARGEGAAEPAQAPPSGAGEAEPSGDLLEELRTSLSAAGEDAAGQRRSERRAAGRRPRTRPAGRVTDGPSAAQRDTRGPSAERAPG
ncbi:Ku protein [Allonocardiopsis opalescens]|uniref:Non-homologous end joining protein Ku n=1 Tax=Allonocardiopsis opalescens TaxID=1144618 RepID=A0A2T0QDK7_9ACTN|nr:Ku protein [Allonocardiopsis opalescens]PRY01988.1 DNA end-binding protein Ku [Allonocardiopsis opalescens]